MFKVSESYQGAGNEPRGIFSLVAPSSHQVHATLGSRLRASRRITVLTRAGISTESGIPDFRGPNGLWAKDPLAQKLSSLQDYVADRGLRVEAWQRRLHHPAWSALPNAGHRALVDLERGGKLGALVTQNIDGLHRRAGTSDDVLVEIHGNMHEVVCLSCGMRGPMRETLERVRAGEADPACRACGGILKSATISFGQSLVKDDLRRARRASESCDLFLAVGTSLAVYPVAYLPGIALASGAKLVILNAQPTRYDALALAVIREPIGEALPALVSWAGPATAPGSDPPEDPSGRST